MVAPYYYVRFRWWQGIDLEKVSADLGKSFSIELRPGHRDEFEISLLKDDRDELRVSADTLSAMLSHFRAVLFQKAALPLQRRIENFERY
jgi:hypothetical protein